MRIDRVLNTKRNIFVGEADKLISIFCPFFVRTLIIHLMGAEYLGVTGLLYSIMQMLNLTEMGFGTAIVYSMYKPISEGDNRAINALLKFYARVYRVVGVCIGAIGLVVMAFLPQLIKDDVPSDINIYILYLIFLLNSCLNCCLFSSRKALLTGYQRDDLSGRMHILSQLLLYTIQALSIACISDFYLYVIAIPISTVAYNLLCAYQTKKTFPENWEEGELAPDILHNIKKQVVGLILRKMASYSRNAFDSMFVSAFLGLEAVAIYGNYYYIMDAVVMVLAVVKTSMAGGVGNSIAIETKEKNMRDMNTINFLFMTIGGWMMIFMLCLYQPFMKLWVGEDMMLPFYMAVLFSVYFYVLKMSDIRTLYAESVGIWWQGRYLSIAEAVANLALNWLLVKYMGMVGIVLATLLSYFVFNFIGGAVILYRYYFNEMKMLPYFLSHLRYLLVTAVVAGVTYGLASCLKTNGVLTIVVRFLVCVLVPGILYFLFYFRTQDFKNAIPLLKGAMKK